MKNKKFGRILLSSSTGVKFGGGKSTGLYSLTKYMSEFFFSNYKDFYKKNVNFKVLGPVGDIIEKWTLYGTFIEDAAFGDLDFSDSQPVEIALTLSYDYAILEF